MVVADDAGAAGVVIWIDAEAINHPQALAAYATTRTGPEAQRFVAAVEACSSANCSSHGRCIPVGSSYCVCDDGYSGVRCAAFGTAPLPHAPHRHQPPRGGLLTGFKYRPNTRQL